MYVYFRGGPKRGILNKKAHLGDGIMILAVTFVG